MLTSHIQYNASLKAAEQLRSSLDAPVNKQLPANLVEANRRKLQRKLDKIDAEIAEYERNRSLDVEEIKITSLEDMLVAPIKYRLAKNESVDEFAKHIGVNKRQVLRYEASLYQNCSIPTLQQILSKIGLVLKGYIGDPQRSA